MSESTVFQVPGTMQDVRLTRHRSAIVKVETQEEMPDALISRLASLTGKDGFFTFSVENIKPEDIMGLPAMPKIDGKTPSQRLRAVLWVLAKQQEIQDEKFEEFYNKKVNYCIEMFKAELEPGS